MSKPQTPLPRLVCAEEVAQAIGASPKTVYKLARDGRIPSLKLGGTLVRFDPVEISNWIESNRRAA